MSGQRAFVQKLSKKGAAEVRKQVSSACLSDLNKSISGLNLAQSLQQSTVPLNDVVDPPDFEEYIAENQNAIDRDVMSQLLEYPTDDIQVKRICRPVRTIAPVIPERSSDIDSSVLNIIKCYTSDYTVVSRRYDKFVVQHWSPVERQAALHDAPKQEYEIDISDSNSDQDTDSLDQQTSSLSTNDTPRGSWASSIFDLKNSQADVHLPNLLDNTPANEIDQENTAQRKKNRPKALFHLYPMQSEDEFIEKREPAQMPKEHFGHRLLLTCKSLRLDMEIEPIFACIALYDAKEKKKISENFYFDMTQDSVKKLLEGHIPYQDVSTLSRSCIFSITYPSPDIFIVIKLEKVLQQGDISEVTEPYMSDKDKNKEKARQNAALFCERLGKYRMPFAWTAVQLMSVLTGSALDSDKDSTRSDSLDRRTSMLGLGAQYDSFRRKMTRDDSASRHSSLERQKLTPDKRSSWTSEDIGAAIDSFKPLIVTVSSFFKQESDKLTDEDLFKFLTELKKPQSSQKKFKCMPGTLKLDISPCPNNLSHCLTPELYKVDPYPDEKGRPIKEIVEFPVSDVYEPYTTYRNLLFVYPKSLNFSNRQGSARNIAVKVNLMEGEDEQCALPVIFGKSSCPEFSKEAYTTVTYHSKSPDFYEEIKIKLPARLCDNHHLLFTFYHISCQVKCKDRELTMPVESAIGYTWLPLLHDGRLVTGEKSLPVSAEKPPQHYSAVPPDVHLPHIKWVDNHKGLFNIEIKAITSVHTLDERLDFFLKMVQHAEDKKIPHAIGEQNFESELKRSITELSAAKPGPLIRFLPLILDKLFQLMIQPPIIAGQLVNTGQITFDAIASIVRRVKQTVESKNDQHGRNSLLTCYIEYCSTLVTSDDMPYNASLSPTYGGLARPLSMPAGSTEPNIALSPDGEVASLMAGRTGSFRKQEVSGYQHMIPVSRKKLIHEAIAYQWAMSVGSSKELAFSNAWFFFEMMIKSMSVYLSRTNQLLGPRTGRFPAQFLEDLASLIQVIIKDIVEKYNKDFFIIRNLNTNFAFFLNDCLSLVDRGFVLEMIAKYCRAMCEKINSHPDGTSAITLKLEFLRIVCSHEHFVTLNLPFGTVATPSAPPSPCPSITSTSSQLSYVSSTTLRDRGLYMELTNQFRHQHFLVGLVLSELSIVLDTHNPNLHYKAINVVRNLLASHDTDPRYQDPEVKARVCTLYLPLVEVVLSALPQLYDPDMDKKSHHGRNEAVDEVAQMDFKIAMAISGSSVYGGIVSPSTELYDIATSKTNTKSPLNQECTRNLLICLLWVLKNADERILWTWFNDITLSKLDEFLEVLQLCITNFEYKGHRAMQQYSMQTLKKCSDIKSRLEEAILGTGNARSELIMRRRNMSQQDKAPASPGSADNNKLRWRKEQTQWRQTSSDVERMRDYELDVMTEGHLAAEVTMIVLDTLELIVQMQSADSLQGILSSILRILLLSLALNQSASTLQHIFASQRALVSKFPELLFEEETEQCADLCLRLLTHCSSPLASTRSQASASLYLLMRQNFEIGNNFARVKMQVTMSLSSLVGLVDEKQSFNEDHLRKSLKTVLTYAESDVELQETTFPKQVRELVFNLHMILSNTVKMNEFREDPEMLLDLMYRIAKGYQNSPDLRLTWLHNMAKNHSEKGNHAEAAQCLIHSAGLVAEYLNMLEDKPYLPVGCVNFQHISSNVLEESAVSDDVVSPDEEGICTGKYFTEHGFIGLLEQAASSFEMAGMYEAMNNVYKVLIPIYEANHNYKKLASSHGKLHDAYINVCKQEGKRVFGTYFRVGFYGSRFGDLDGEEYIYKEPAITKLPEISHRLENFYIDKLGAEYVQIIKDSNTVERDKLHPDKAYIQITYVEPYFDLYEQKDRCTFFQKNYNLRRFMYATPFTMDGRAHGELKDQYKRKTILTVSHSFPYVKTRLPVINREQVILSPIEVAIEDIQKKTKELAVALRQEPPDAKMLQMVLQGCIGTTVNQGPVEVATVFLRPVAAGEAAPSKHHNKLRISFKDFLKKCNDALHRNQSLIGDDQKEYQLELQRNFHKVKERLLPLVSSNISTGTLKKKHKRDKDHRKSHKSHGAEC